MNIQLTLDSFIYKLIINKDEDISFILPHVAPEKIVQNTENVRATTNEVNIKYYIKTNDIIPNVVFVGQDDNMNIITNGNFKLYKNSLTVITFNTVDAGLTWLVTSYDSIDVSSSQDTKDIIKTLDKIQEKLDNIDTTQIQEKLENIETGITALTNKMSAVVSHVVNTENSIFWIDNETLKPTRPCVDPDTLEPLT